MQEHGNLLVNWNNCIGLWKQSVEKSPKNLWCVAYIFENANAQVMYGKYSFNSDPEMQWTQTTKQQIMLEFV